MSRPRILCVDDEPQVLQGIRRALFKVFEIKSAESGTAALELIDRGERFDVVVSDMRMPNMNGATLLAEVRRRVPEVTRVLLTGHADIEAAIAAVNRGQIFRFLTKPCSPGELSSALSDAVTQHRLLTSEKVLLEQTLLGSVRALSEVLSLVNPEVFGPSMRQHARTRAICEHLHLPNAWQVEVASMLSAVGYVVLPSDVAAKLRAGTTLEPNEVEMTHQMPGVVERVLSFIPRLESVRALLQEHESLRTPQPTGKPATVPAHVLHAVVELGALEQKFDTPTAVRELRGAGRHPAAVVDALVAVCQLRAPVLKKLALAEIESGLILAADVKSKAGVLLMAHGQVVSDALLRRMRNIHLRVGVVEPILCEVPAPAETGQPTAGYAGSLAR
jgi:CheY-like chemotaxis protein